jgi:hypothetical protein
MSKRESKGRQQLPDYQSDRVLREPQKAFGVVLYEMLPGRQAFTSETITDVLASVVKEQPTLDEVPAPARPVLARCLSKDGRTRWGDIGDVRWARSAVAEGAVGCKW